MHIRDCIRKILVVDDSIPFSSKMEALFNKRSKEIVKLGFISGNKKPFHVYEYTIGKVC